MLQAAHISWSGRNRGKGMMTWAEGSPGAKSRKRRCKRGGEGMRMKNDRQRGVTLDLCVTVP